MRLAFTLEPALLEPHTELEVDAEDAAPVLLDRDDGPFAEPFGVAHVVDEVVARHGIVLLVHDEHRVGLVGERRRAAHVLGAHTFPRLDVPAGLAKGLGFEHVVLLEPADIVASEADEPTGLRRVYVCRTRAVASLVVCHWRHIPVP